MRRSVMLTRRTRAESIAVVALMGRVCWEL